MNLLRFDHGGLKLSIQLTIYECTSGLGPRFTGSGLWGYIKTNSEGHAEYALVTLRRFLFNKGLI